jgi:cobalamin synthase
MMTKMPMPEHPRLMMLMMGPAIGIVSGLVLGLFAFIASKWVKNK